MSPSQPFLVLPTHAGEGQQRERSSSSSAAAVKRRAYASLVLLVLAATAAMLLFDAAFPPLLETEVASADAPYTSVFPLAYKQAISTPSPTRHPRPPPPPLPEFPSASCMHFIGGGAARPGGAFPQARQRSPRCWPSVRAYFERGDYLADVAEAVGDAREVLRFYSRPSRDLVVVFDIDETSLSNADEWMKGGEGGKDAPLGLGFDLDPLAALERRALLASSPPLRATLELYKDAYAAGFSVAFVTGRKDRGDMRAATAKNLEEAGYGRECGGGGGGGGDAEAAGAEAPPCYLSLMMRSPEDARPASVYKPEARAKLLLLGGSGGNAGTNLTLVASLGDQFSDLVGPSGAHASFKLPNPVYAIL